MIMAFLGDHKMVVEADNCGLWSEGEHKCGNNNNNANNKDCDVKHTAIKRGIGVFIVMAQIQH